jgi:phosphatidylglycerol lysyltransferase
MPDRKKITPSVSQQKRSQFMPAAADLSDTLIQARRLVFDFGRSATSWQILNPDLSFWFSADGEGVAGFATYRGVRVVAGEPVCDVDRLAAVCREFEQDAADAGQRVCYLAAESPLVERLGLDGRHVVIPIGAQPVWQPAALSAVFREAAALRYQLNRARSKGLSVSEWPANRFDHPGLHRCLAAWLAEKSLPALGFMTDPYLLGRMDARRLWGAEKDGVMAGYTVLAPVPARSGWLVEQIVRCGGAPNGTAESLVATAAHDVAAEDSRFITLGTSPLSRRGERLSSRHPLWLRVITGWMRAHGTRFYNFRGLEHFKAKFRPQAWEPVFAVAVEPRLRMGTLYAAMGAFTGRSPIVAGMQAVGGGLRSELRRLVGLRN